MPSRVQASTETLLELLDRHRVKGTLFFLGWVADRNSWKPASAGDRAGFAVGSFLIAGQQLVPLTPGC